MGGKRCGTSAFPGTNQSPQGASASGEAALQPSCGGGLEGALFTLAASRAGRWVPDQKHHLDGALSAFSWPASRRGSSGCGPWRLWGQGLPTKQWQTPWPLPGHPPSQSLPRSSGSSCLFFPTKGRSPFLSHVGLRLCSRGWQPAKMVWDSAMPTLSGPNPLIFLQALCPVLPA